MARMTGPLGSSAGVPRSSYRNHEQQDYMRYMAKKDMSRD